LEAQTGEVVVAGDERVEGARLRKALSDRGYRTVYSAAGPKVLHALASDDVLDRLYLTFTGRMLGGQTFATFVDGPSFSPPVDMRLNTVYFDPHGLDGLGQLFTCYNRVNK
jgi:riboflavin biosynthesis pyrimidine reductase